MPVKSDIIMNYSELMNSVKCTGIIRVVSAAVAAVFAVVVSVICHKIGSNSNELAIVAACVTIN